MTAVAVDEAHAVRDAEWLGRLRAAEQSVRQAQAAVLELLGDPDAPAIAARTGYGTLARLVSAMLLISPADARSRISAADALTPGRTVTGAPLDPRCPATAAAFTVGDISLTGVRLITETVAALPATVHPDVVADTEATLAGYARRFAPGPLAAVCRRVLAHLDPDGHAPAEPSLRHRELHLRPRPDGALLLDGTLDPEGASVVRTVLDSLNTRRPDTGDGPDLRSLPQRNADALTEACRRLLDAGALPTTGGTRPHLVLTMTLDQLRDSRDRPGASGDRTAARLGYSEPVDAATARRLACDATVIPAVLDGRSQPLDVGQAQRTATPAIRTALALRDRGCAFPGCDAPPHHCTAHHITHWADGGPTALHNLTLLCRWHHHLVHHSDWQIRIHGGRPEFIPPRYLDPDRTPHTNPRYPLRC